MTIITVDASKPWNGSLSIKISKPFPTSGGNSYETNISVNMPNGDRAGRLTGVNVENVDAICTYNNAKKGKANILQRIEKNPGITNFLDAAYQELTRACTDAGLPVPKPYVSRDQPPKDGKTYPDTAFTKANVDDQMQFIRAKVLIYDDETEEYKILLGTKDVNADILESYGDNAIKDRSIPSLLKSIYGVEVIIDKSKKVITKVPPQPLEGKRLLGTAEFNDEMKKYTVVGYQAKFNNYFAKGDEGFCTFISDKLICDNRISDDQESEDAFDKLLTSRKDKPKSNTIPSVDEIDPNTGSAEDVWGSI